MTAVRGRAIIRGGGWRAGWGRGRFRVESAVGMGVVGRWVGGWWDGKCDLEL